MAKLVKAFKTDKNYVKNLLILNKNYHSDEVKISSSHSFKQLFLSMTDISLINSNKKKHPNKLNAFLFLIGYQRCPNYFFLITA